MTKLIKRASGEPLPPHYNPLPTNKKEEEKSKKVSKAAQQQLQSSIDTPGRPGVNKRIEIPVANFSGKNLRLERKNLKEIFKYANEFTVNIRYPIQNNSRMIEGVMVHRPNHNGTHSGRQARMVEAMFDLIEGHGFPKAKNQLASLTEEEKLNLELGAYFLRAGRVDETTHKHPNPDDYYTRSALIYEAYAWQLGVKPEIIQWVKGLIIDSCKPLSHENKKDEFGYLLLTTAHKLDLIRSYNDEKFKANIEEATRDLGSLVPNSEHYVSQLVDYAKQLTAATGAFRKVDGYPGDSNLFALCSTEGDKCWEAVQAVKIPDWKPIKSKL